jgi:hypothetical protein
MFFASVFVILVGYMVYKRYQCQPRHRARILHTQAILENGRDPVRVKTPADIPEDTRYFMIEYEFRGSVYKLMRRSITIPVYVLDSANSRVVKRVVTADRHAVDVTSWLVAYAGPRGDFVGHDVPVASMLKYEGCQTAATEGAIVSTCANMMCYVPQGVLTVLHHTLCYAILGLTYVQFITRYRHSHVR